MRKPVAVFLLAALAAFALLGTQLTAAIIPPIGLAPGSQYQLVFVTVGTHDAVSSNIADYNAFVAAQAALNPLLPSATWHAVASTDAINAVANAPSSGLSVYNTHGVLVSTALSRFYFSEHFSPILYDQFGAASSLRSAWTGSTPEGIEYHSGSVGGLGNMTGGLSVDGDPSQARFYWADGTADGLPALFGFYALSTPITVPVPEPATITLLGSAFLLLGGMRFLRWRRRAS